MKNTVALVLVLLFALFTLHVMSDSANLVFNFDGDELGSPFGGPFGWLCNVLFGGIGLLIGCVALLLAGVLLALVFAGVGVIVVVVALLIVALVLVAALAPVLLPLFIPIVIIAYLMKRSRKNTGNAQV